MRVSWASTLPTVVLVPSVCWPAAVGPSPVELAGGVSDCVEATDTTCVWIALTAIGCGMWCGGCCGGCGGSC